MSEWQSAAYKEYWWIVADPDLLGGKLALRGSRTSESLILGCLANGMTLDDMNSALDGVISSAVLSEVLQAASEVADSFLYDRF